MLGPHSVMRPLSLWWMMAIGGESRSRGAGALFLGAANSVSQHAGSFMVVDCDLWM
jgi:hypothetical protein